MRSRSVKPWKLRNLHAAVLPLLLGSLICAIWFVSFTVAQPTTATSEASEPSETTPETSSEALTVVLDPEASTVTFTLGATLHTVEGSFQVEEGEITFDPTTGEASGRVVVDATSGDSGNDSRDRDMHAKVLESESYPDFVFTPTRIEGDFQPSGASQVTLHGTLAIHGDEHEISIPATVAVNPVGDASETASAESSGNGELRLEATGSFEVPYVEWGLEDPSKFILRVKKSVDVTVRAVGRIRR